MSGFMFPQPPFDAMMPQTLQQVLSIVFSAVTVAWTAFALRDCARRRTLVPLYIILGGAIAIFYEPVGDALEMAFYPPNGQHTWLELFGRRVPYFIGISFLSYFGPVIWVFMLLHAKGFTAKSWWGFFLALVVMRIVQDEFILSFGASWIYYGPQPFQIRFFPLWVAFPTAVFQVVIGAGVQTIVSRLPARQHWLVIAAVPVLFIAGHAAAVFPGTLVLYNTQDPLWLHAGVIASVALSCVIIHALGQAFIRRPEKPSL